MRAGAFDTIAPDQPAERHKLLATVGLAIGPPTRSPPTPCRAASSTSRAAAPPMADYVKGAPVGRADKLRRKNRHRLLPLRPLVQRLQGPRCGASCGASSPCGAEQDLVTLAGVVMEVRAKMTARGKIAFVLLDDGTTPRSVGVLRGLRQQPPAHRRRQVLIVEAKVSNDDFSGGLRIVADKLMTLGEARGRFARALQLRRLNGAGGRGRRQWHAVDPPAGRPRTLPRGAMPVRVRYRNAQAEGDLPLGPNWRAPRRQPARPARHSACANGCRRVWVGCTIRPVDLGLWATSRLGPGFGCGCAAQRPARPSSLEPDRSSSLRPGLILASGVTRALRGPPRATPIEPHPTPHFPQPPTHHVRFLSRRTLLDELSARAVSTRACGPSAFNLHDSPEARRRIVCWWRWSLAPWLPLVHLGPHKAETIIVLRGRLGVLVFDDDEGGCRRPGR